MTQHDKEMKVDKITLNIKKHIKAFISVSFSCHLFVL